MSIGARPIGTRAIGDSTTQAIAAVIAAPQYNSAMYGSYSYGGGTGGQVVAGGGSPVGYVKVWSGSVWLEKPVKIWNGSAWVQKPVKVWSGSAWVPA